jgi:hypothetical protein
MESLPTRAGTGKEIKLKVYFLIPEWFREYLMT